MSFGVELWQQQAKDAYSTVEEFDRVRPCLVQHSIGRYGQALVQPRIGMNVGQKLVVKMHSEIVFVQGASNDVANTNN